MSLLRETRVNKGISQTVMASNLGMSQQAISMYENGGRIPDLITAGRIAEKYGISLDELLKEMKRKSEEKK